VDKGYFIKGEMMVVLDKIDEQKYERLVFCERFVEDNYSSDSLEYKLEMIKLLYSEGFGLVTLFNKELVRQK
jgi:hypothetical protein